MRKVSNTINVCYYDLGMPTTAESNLIASMDSNYIPSVGEIISLTKAYNSEGSKDYKVIKVQYDLDCFSQDGIDKDAARSTEMIRIDVSIVNAKGKKK